MVSSYLTIDYPWCIVWLYLCLVSNRGFCETSIPNVNKALCWPCGAVRKAFREEIDMRLLSVMSR